MLKDFFDQRTSSLFFENILNQCWGLFVCLFVGTFVQDIACINEEDHKKLHKSLVLTVIVLVKLNDGEMFNNQPLYMYHQSF